MIDIQPVPVDALRDLYASLRHAVDDAISALGPPLDDLEATDLATFKRAERRAIQLFAEIVAVQDGEERG